MNHNTLLAAALCSLTLTGCGSSDSGSSGGGGNAGSGGSAGSSAGSGGVSGGGTGASSATGGAGGGAGGQQCSDFANQSSTHSVTLTVKNERTTPIYLGDPNAGCVAKPLIQLKDSQGKVVKQGQGGCGTCERALTTTYTCNTGCAKAPLIRIDAGGSYEKVWDGTAHHGRDMPLACYFDPQHAPQQCIQRVVASDDTYSVQVSAWADASCASGCNCQSDAKGSCEIISGGAPIGAETTGTASFTFPAQSAVTVTFQ